MAHHEVASPHQGGELLIGVDGERVADELDRVGCATNAENHRSIAVAERLGMSVITETTAPSDDETRMVAAVLLQVDRSDWLVTRSGRNERT